MVQEPSDPRSYALHEAAHALVAHLCGFPVDSIRIDPEHSRGECCPERGFDPDEACAYVRDHATEPQASELLPLLKRDLAGRLAGMLGDEIFGIQGSEAEYKRDRECAAKLARDIAHATWIRSVPRPPLQDREQGPQYEARMRAFVSDHLLAPSRAVIAVLAEEIEARHELNATEIANIFARHSVPFGGVTDRDLP